MAHISKVKYLGYAFYCYKGKSRFRVYSKSVAKVKDKIRKLTKRSNRWGNEHRAMKLTEFIRGWVNYFSLADMKGILRENDEWLRHKVRTIYLETMEESQDKIQVIKEVRCGRRKGMDIRKYAKWKLVLWWIFCIADCI